MSKTLTVPCKTFLLNAGHQTGGTIDYQTLGSQGKGVAVCQTPRFHTFQMFKLNFISVVIHNGSITPSLFKFEHIQGFSLHLLANKDSGKRKAFSV